MVRAVALVWEDQLLDDAGRVAARRGRCEAVEHYCLATIHHGKQHHGASGMANAGIADRATVSSAAGCFDSDRLSHPSVPSGVLFSSLLSAAASTIKTTWEPKLVCATKSAVAVSRQRSHR